MRMKVLWVLALALAVAPLASADITLTFSSGVTVVGFYSVEGYSLHVTSNGTSAATGVFAANYGSGNFNAFSDTNVTELDFHVDSPTTPDFYALDDIKYMVGNTTYTLTFDEFNMTGDVVGSYYSLLPGSPTFNGVAEVLSHSYDSSGNEISSYNYSGYPAESCSSDSRTCSVLGETLPVPEPGALVLLGSGLIGLASLLPRRAD